MAYEYKVKIDGIQRKQRVMAFRPNAVEEIVTDILKLVNKDMKDVEISIKKEKFSYDDGK